MSVTQKLFGSGAATTFWGSQSNGAARAGAAGYTGAVPGRGGNTGNNVATIPEKSETRKRTCDGEGRCAQLWRMQMLMQEGAAHPVVAEMTRNTRSHGFVSHFPLFKVRNGFRIKIKLGCG